VSNSGSIDGAQVSSRASLPALGFGPATALAAVLAAVLVLKSCGGEAAPKSGAAAVPRDVLPALRDADGAADLASGEAVRLPLLVPDGGSLRLALRGAGEGTLSATVALPGGRELTEEAVLELSGDADVEHTLPLPASGEDLLQVELAFASDDDGARLDFSAAELRGAGGGTPVIFVSIDTLSARHLDLYGYARETAPNLRRFAEEAVVFERCLTNAPWTTPSYMAQWTGLLPWSHKFDKADDGYPAFVSDERVTLAEAFGAAGYRTAAFVDNPNVTAAYGLDQGFEVFDTSAARIPKIDHSGGARKVFADGLSWLEGLAPDDPYFLILQVLDVHGPYAPTPPFRGAFADDGLGVDAGEFPVAGREGTFFDAIPRYIATLGGTREAPESVPTAPLVDAYDEEILQLDAALGELFGELRARGVLDDAIVIVSADHGESLTEHHTLFSHSLAYDEVAHVPLLVRLPGGREGGRRVADGAQLVDLYPTLVELAGLSYRPALHGRSLVPALDGEALPPRPLIVQGDTFDVQAIDLEGVKLVEWLLSPEKDQLAFASHPLVREWFAERYAIDPDLVPGTSALPLADLEGVDLAEAWAAVERDFAEPLRELYRIARDPRELDDLAAAEPETVAHLAELLAAVRALTLAEQRDPGAARPELDAELLRELQALGYVEGR